MFNFNLSDKSDIEAIEYAYNHFAENNIISTFSAETQFRIYTAAIRTYCYDNDLIVSDSEIHTFLNDVLGKSNNNIVA